MLLPGRLLVFPVSRIRHSSATKERYWSPVPLGLRPDRDPDRGSMVRDDDCLDRISHNTTFNTGNPIKWMQDLIRLYISPTLLSFVECTNTPEVDSWFSYLYD
jgi:hypothetical protein